MKLFLSDVCRLRPRVRFVSALRGARPVLAVMLVRGASRVLLPVFRAILLAGLIVFLARLRECGGGWVVCGCEVVVCASRGAGSVAVY